MMDTMDSPAQPVFKHYLKEWRELRGMRQEDLAARIRTTKSVISRWETGQRGMKIESWIALSYALGITPPQLFQHPDSAEANDCNSIVARKSPSDQLAIRKIMDTFPDVVKS